MPDIVKGIVEHHQSLLRPEENKFHVGNGSDDAAPAVCEWKQLGDRHGHFTRECSKYPTTSAAGDYCSNCGKPIKFTEVK